MRFQRWIALFTLIAFIGIPAGSGSVQAESDVDSVDLRIVEVSMTEFSFTPSSIEIYAGETARFIVTNNGVAKHDFEIATQHEIDEHIAGGHKGHDGNGPAETKELRLELAAGETGEFIVTFDDTQELLFVCIIPGHYEAGMIGTFILSGTPLDNSGNPPTDEISAIEEVNVLFVLNAIYIVDSFGFHSMAVAYDEATEVGSRDAGNIRKIILAVQVTVWPEELEHQVEAILEDLEILHEALETEDLDASREAFHTIHGTQHDLSNDAYLWFEAQIAGEEFHDPEENHH